MPKKPVARKSNASPQTRLERFKNDDESRSTLRDLLNHPVMIEAFDLLRSEYEGVDVPTEAPEVSSVRALSMRAGFDLFPIKLRSLTDVPITAKEPLKETWDEKQ